MVVQCSCGWSMASVTKWWKWKLPFFRRCCSHTNDLGLPCTKAMAMTPRMIRQSNRSSKKSDYPIWWCSGAFSPACPGSTNAAFFPQPLSEKTGGDRPTPYIIGVQTTNLILESRDDDLYSTQICHKARNGQTRLYYNVTGLT